MPGPSAMTLPCTGPARTWAQADPREEPRIDLRARDWQQEQAAMGWRRKRGHEQHRAGQQQLNGSAGSCSGFTLFHHWERVVKCNLLTLG